MRKPKSKLRSLGTIKIAVIGASGFKQLFESGGQSQSEMPNGITLPLSIGKIDDKKVVFLPRHGSDQSVNFRALKVSKQIMLGIEKVLIETIRSLPLKRKNTCPCVSPIRNSRFE